MMDTPIRGIEYKLDVGAFVLNVKNPLYGQRKVSGRHIEEAMDVLAERVKRTSKWEIRQARKNYPQVVFSDNVFEVQLDQSTISQTHWKIAIIHQCFHTPLPTHYVRLQEIVNRDTVPNVVRLYLSPEEWAMIQATANQQ